MPGMQEYYLLIKGGSLEWRIRTLNKYSLANGSLEFNLGRAQHAAVSLSQPLSVPSAASFTITYLRLIFL